MAHTNDTFAPLDTLAPVGEDPNVGTVLQDRYRIVRKLGEGGMGRVYEGEHVLIKRRVAIKCLHAQYASDPAVVSRFHREALAATSIGNEHIIECTDMGRFPDGAIYMVLEFLEGSDLADRIEDQGCLTVGRAARIALQICDALGAAHAKGIVHRDLKPENVFLVQRSGNPDFVKVLDFGISKFQDGTHSGKTGSGIMLGTPSYMAPEQIEGRSDVDHRIDVYAIGVILYAMLTGAQPFVAESMPMLVYAICATPPPLLRERRPDAPEALEAVINRCLAKNRDDRFPDCEALAAALRPFTSIDDVPVLASPARSSVRPAFGPLSKPSSTPAPALALGTSETMSGVSLQRRSSGITGSPRPSSRSKQLLAAAIALGTLMGVSVWAITRASRTAAPLAVPSTASVAPSARPAAPAPTPAPTVAASAEAPAPSAPAPAAAPPPSAPPAATVAAPAQPAQPAAATNREPHRAARVRSRRTPAGEPATTTATGIRIR